MLDNEINIAIEAAKASGKLLLENKNNLNANFSFKILKDFINLTNANFKYLDYIFKSKSIIVKKNSNNFVKVNGDLFSKKIEINKKDLKKIISLEIDNFIGSFCIFSCVFCGTNI